MSAVFRTGICTSLSLLLFFGSVPQGYAETRADVGKKYEAYKQARSSDDPDEIIAAGEEFLNEAEVGVLTSYGKIKRNFKEDPIGTTLFSGVMLGIGGVVFVPVAILNFFERGGKSGQTMLANKNHKGLDILLSKWEQRNFWGSMGDAYYERKHLEKAAAAYKRAIQLDEAFRLTLAREDRRVGYFSRYHSHLNRLIEVLYENGFFEQALAYMELGKAKTLRESFMASNARRIEKRAVREVLLAKAQIETTLQKKQIHQEEFDNLKRSIEVTKKEAFKETSDRTSFLLGNLVSQAFTLDTLDFLPPETIVLTYYVTQHGLYSMALENGRILGSHMEPISREELAGFVARFNNAAQSGAAEKVSSIGEVLYDHLISPYELFLNGDRLLVSPHGILHHLPFSGLYHSGYLIERQPIGYIYSLSFLDLMTQRHGNRPLQSRELHPLVMGNPLNGNLPAPPLPGAEKEVQRVAARLNGMNRMGRANAYVRNEASEERCKKEIEKANLVHLATHSKFDTNSAESSFILLSDGKGQDGLLHASEIYELPVTGGIELVVMSSCESGAVDVKPGDDPYGLNRAWFYIGAKRIVSTFWPIEDQAASRIIEAYYQNFLEKGHDFHESLQQAQVAMIRSGSMSWIPFKIEGLSGEVAY
jgi:CHAT domain-containing protein